MTDLAMAAVMILVLIIGYRWIAGPEPKVGKPVDWFKDGVDGSCEWGTCDCVGKCEKREEEKN